MATNIVSAQVDQTVGRKPVTVFVWEGQLDVNDDTTNVVIANLLNNSRILDYKLDVIAESNTGGTVQALVAYPSGDVTFTDAVAVATTGRKAPTFTPLAAIDNTDSGAEDPPLRSVPIEIDVAGITGVETADVRVQLVVDRYAYD